MRVLWVFEVADAEGEFHPKIGLGDREDLTKWLEHWLSVNLDRKPHEWRIVKYAPLEMPNGPIIN
jgi:hypothetical protein